MVRDLGQYTSNAAGYGRRAVYYCYHGLESTLHAVFKRQLACRHLPPNSITDDFEVFCSDNIPFNLDTILDATQALKALIPKVRKSVIIGLAKIKATGKIPNPVVQWFTKS